MVPSTTAMCGAMELRAESLTVTLTTEVTLMAAHTSSMQQSPADPAQRVSPMSTTPCAMYHRRACVYSVAYTLCVN